jgi:small-conductance mechanosensitive channel
MSWLARPLVTIGQTEVSLATVALFVVSIVLVVVVARTLGGLVSTRLLARTPLDPGLQYAIGRITYYALLVIGLMVALQTVGIQLGSLAVLMGAIGVGIGFGLQNVVNNFVSGLILLAERPVKVGDRIEVTGTVGRVEQIGARSTTVVTNDNIQIIIPNADMVTSKIVNWSHGDGRVRFRVAVGVAYGSDLARVRDVLLGVAAAHAAVLPQPPPSVRFAAFGDSALNLELLVWTREMVQSPSRFRSDLNFAIDAAFRGAGIEVPFPQRDVHLRHGGADARAEPG